jgi:hypothetical protein
MLRSFFALLILLGTFTTPALAEKRVALVIGNSAYRYIPPLANSVNDARLMAETLRAVGFSLAGGGVQLDLDEAAFRRAVQNFGNQLQGSDVGLVYYAGLGVQVRGANYLVPVGANPTKEADVDFQMLDANLILRQMESAGTKLNLVILDACRNNPFGGRGLRTVATGLATMQATEGTLISFATQPGNVAFDGAYGNSPFARALAQTIRRPGLDIFQTFNEVGLAVMRATGGAQQPWVSSSPISGAFYFAGQAAGIPQPIPAPPTPVLMADEVFWLTIKDSVVAGVFEEFLKKFPTSRYATEARQRLAQLKAAAKKEQLQTALATPEAPLATGAQTIARGYVVHKMSYIKGQLVDLQTIRNYPEAWNAKFDASRLRTAPPPGSWKLGPVPDTNVVGCAKACDAIPGCRAFELNPYHYCSLFSTFEGLGSSDDHVSGIRE